jgi:CDP-glucose 4,6-dehydratase
MTPGFWRNKRVFLTGHTGFKGSWLALWLQHLGAEVTGFALVAPTQPSLFAQARVDVGMKSIIGDVRDLPALQQAMRNARPEIVIHMAAQALVRYSYQNPVETYATNVMGTVHLLESIRHTTGVRAVVNVTSDKCYENGESQQGYSESAPMGGYDPYSNSKGCAELVSAAYRSSFFNAASYAQHGVALATARAGNVVGGGDWAQDRLIPDMIRAFAAGQAVIVRNPKSIRPWQHVLAPLSGYLSLAERLYFSGSDYAEGWNFGPDDADSKTVEWIVDRFCQAWGGGASWRLDSGSQPYEASYLKLECGKARARLDWQSAWHLSDAIDNIVEWHRAQAAGADMRQVCINQIMRYEQENPSYVLDKP